MTISCTVKNLEIFMAVTISCMKNLLIGVDNKGDGRKVEGLVYGSFFYFGAFGKNMIKEYPIRKR